MLFGQAGEEAFWRLLVLVQMHLQLWQLADDILKRRSRFVAVHYLNISLVSRPNSMLRSPAQLRVSVAPDLRAQVCSRNRADAMIMAQTYPPFGACRAAGWDTPRLVENLVRHGLGAGRVTEALQLLTDYRWMQRMNDDKERAHCVSEDHRRTAAVAHAFGEAREDGNAPSSTARRVCLLG